LIRLVLIWSKFGLYPYQTVCLFLIQVIQAMHRGLSNGLRVLSRSSIFNLLRDLARDPAPCNSYITTDYREFSSPITLKETTGQTVAEELLGKIAFDHSKKLSLKTLPCMKSSHFKAKQAVTRSNGPQGSWACQSVHSNQ
jgi:hypothetical protein